MILITKDGLREEARRILAECDFFDTETNWNDESTDAVIDIAVIEGDTGAVVLDTLVHTDLVVSDRATALHGIDNDALKSAPRPAAIVAMIRQRIANGRQLAAFNLRFDVWSLSNTADPETVRPQQNWDPFESVIPWDQRNDVMELANRYFAEHLFWDVQTSKFRRLSLARCCELAGVEFTGKAHRALADAVAARGLVVAIAEGVVAA